MIERDTKPFTATRWEFFVLATESILATAVVFLAMNQWMPVGTWKRGAFATVAYIVILAALLPAQNVVSRHYHDSDSSPRWTITAAWLVVAGLVGGILTVALLQR